MSEPPDGIGVDQWRKWTPQAQQQALAALEKVRNTDYRPFYCPKGAHTSCDGKPHDEWQWKHARTDQHPPKGDWLTWLLRGGRGSGKTRTGAEWLNRMAQRVPRLGIVAPTASDARDTMIEDESGILACAAPGQTPEYEPSKKRLTWPNGSRCLVFSGEEPDRLRGKNMYAYWLDEPAHTDNIDEVWDNLLLGLRKGEQPRICCTTTPLPIKWIKDLSVDPDTVTVVVSTYANIDNLSPVFRKKVLSKFEGTRKGRQELHGEILDDVEGALWDIETMVDPHRVAPEDLPEMDRIVVSIDPAGTARIRSDETGIVVVGIMGEHLYVLADGSGKMSPQGWADKSLRFYGTWHADALVAEQTYGGDMVLRNLTASVPKGTILPKIEKPSTRRGKKLRADPVVGLYERGLVHHLRGADLSQLEDQMATWVPTVGESPDRVDALVHGITALAQVVAPSQIASPVDRSFRTLEQAKGLVPSIFVASA